MKSYNYIYDKITWPSFEHISLITQVSSTLILCFGSKKMLSEEGIYDTIKEKFSNAEIVICTTSGEIFNSEVLDESIVITVLEFEKTDLNSAMVNIKDYNNSFDPAVDLFNALDRDDLTYLMVISDGHLVNGSNLVKSFNEVSKGKVIISGGLAGDGANFNSTYVGLNCQPSEGNILAIAFYGKNLIVSHGSRGGWERFGLDKVVTKSTDNILYELDNKKALDIYKQYLGDESDNLPSSALMFPLAVFLDGNKEPVVRTILSISEEDQSMTFAGDIPQGSVINFMKANFDKITSAAYDAAVQTSLFNKKAPEYALLISCVGRKIVLGHRVNEEVEAIESYFGKETKLSGFYSYGEISPIYEISDCNLHNQTMTITTFYEN